MAILLPFGFTCTEKHEKDTGRNKDSEYRIYTLVQNAVLQGIVEFDFEKNIPWVYKY